MITTVYVGTLLPMLFLLLVLKDANRRLVLFLLWGLTASLAAYYLNAAARDLLRTTAVYESDHIAPVLEEFLEALPVYLYLFARKNERSYEVVRNALASGIGFSILENVAYLTTLAPVGAHSRLLFIVLRSVSACLLHGATTSLTGYAIREMRLYRLRSPLMLLGVLLVAILLHGIFNWLAGNAKLWELSIAVPVALFAVEFFVWNVFGRRSASLPSAVVRQGGVQ